MHCHLWQQSLPAASIWFENWRGCGWSEFKSWGSGVQKVQQTEARTVTQHWGYHPRNFYLCICFLYQKVTTLESAFISYSCTS